VNAHFLRTSLEVRGRVEGTPGVKGKTIALDVAVREGRVEDLMRLATRGKPPMTGAVSFQTRFVLPPGEAEIAERLRLNGSFGTRAAQFTNPALRQKVGALSRRAQGRPKEAEDLVPDDVASNFRGRFVLKKSIVSFSRLSFDVPGATVNLDGTYGLRNEQLDFRGKVRMQAKLSQTQTGIKSFFLKALDPFFAKEGAGAVLPIKITGTRDQPKFGLNLRCSKDTARKEQ
jgi:AsmA-like C-terminal region